MVSVTCGARQAGRQAGQVMAEGIAVMWSFTVSVTVVCKTHEYAGRQVVWSGHGSGAFHDVRCDSRM